MSEQFPSGDNKGQETTPPEKAKGFYKFDQKIIEEGRMDERYKTDKGFRMAIDIKALHNEVIRMAPIGRDYSNDEVIKNLLSEIEQFEKSHNLEMNGTTVRLRDMLDTKNEKERKKFFIELVTYLSGMDSGMDMVINKIKEKE